MYERKFVEWKLQFYHVTLMRYAITSFAPVSLRSSKELGLRTCKTVAQNSVNTEYLNMLHICTSEYVIPCKVVLYYLSTYTGVMDCSILATYIDILACSWCSCILYVCVKFLHTHIIIPEHQHVAQHTIEQANRLAQCMVC